MTSLPATCPSCGASMLGPRVSSAVDPGATLMRWRAICVVQWVPVVHGERPRDSQVGWMCATPGCLHVEPVEREGGGVV